MESVAAFLFPIFIMFALIWLAIKHIFGNAAIDHAKGMLLYDLLRVAVALPFKVIGFILRRIF